jgi:hypothetical protein
MLSIAVAKLPIKSPIPSPVFADTFLKVIPYLSAKAFPEVSADCLWHPSDLFASKNMHYGRILYSKASFK